ncbi:MAG: hypothetical protein ABIL39_07285 [candidate division WOR-3 bacterium]
MIPLLIISAAGISGLIMPHSPKGLLTYYSRATGTEAIFYNPSLFIADQSRYTVNFSYAHLYQSMRNMNLGLGRKFHDFNLGVNIMNFDYGDIEAHPDYPTGESTGFYTGSDFCIGILLSKNFTQNGRIGIKTKYIYENLYIYSGATLAVDFSLAYMNEISGLSLGATNIGGTIKIANETVNLPAKLSGGYYRKFGLLTLSGDLHYLVNTSSFESSLAAELELSKKLMTGFAINYRDQVFPGFYLGITHNLLHINYGASLYPYNLGMVNSVGIGVSF